MQTSDSLLKTSSGIFLTAASIYGVAIVSILSVLLFGGR